jgi:hypothetical protein
MRLDQAGRTPPRQPALSADRLEALERASALRRSAQITRPDAPALVHGWQDSPGLPQERLPPKRAVLRQQPDSKADEGTVSAPVRSASEAVSRPQSKAQFMGFSIPGGDAVMKTLNRGMAFASSTFDRVQSSFDAARGAGQKTVDAVVNNQQLVQRQIDGLSTLVKWMYPANRTLAQSATTPVPNPPAPVIFAPRTIDEVRDANPVPAVGVPNGDGDLGQKYTSAVRAPYGPVGFTDLQLGQAAMERTLADTSVGSQIQNDEFEVIRHDNGKFTLVLPGVIDLSKPHLGLYDTSKSVRDIDQTALNSSVNSKVESNLYAMMVRDYVLDPKNGIPTGADVMLVGHSLGADTVMDLAADPVFNNSQTGVNVTHVMAAAYFNQPELDKVPESTQVLVLQNNRDVPVIAEGLGYTVTEVRNEAARVVGGAKRTVDDVLGIGGSLLNGDLGGVFAHGGDIAGQAQRVLTTDSLPMPDAAALLSTGVRNIDGHIVEARFAGGAKGAGHHQQNYIDYINGAGSTDPSVSSFMASVASAGYAAPGETNAVDISVDDPAYRTTYPGDGVVKDVRGFWNSLPGSGIVEDVVGAGVNTVSSGLDIAGDAASAAWSQRGLLGDARDAVRDGALATWNVLPGNDAVEYLGGAVGDAVFDYLPFNNAASAGFQALTGSDSITLDTDATQAIQRDPSFLKTEQGIVDSIKQRDGYGTRAMDIPLKDLDVNLTVELGGQRGKGDMTSQALNAWNFSDPEIAKTWGVATNEFTWLLRHARLDGTAHVAADGSISIDYGIHDRLDLRPGAGRSAAYNAVTTVAGTVWHDILGAEAAQINGQFSRQVPR